MYIQLLTFCRFDVINLPYSTQIRSYKLKHSSLNSHCLQFHCVNDNTIRNSPSHVPLILEELPMKWQIYIKLINHRCNCRLTICLYTCIGSHCSIKCTFKFSIQERVLIIKLTFYTLMLDTGSPLHPWSFPILLSWIMMKSWATLGKGYSINSGTLNLQCWFQGPGLGSRRAKVVSVVRNKMYRIK